MSGEIKTIIKHFHDILVTVKIPNSSKSVIGFSRSLLAAGMLLTLLFNDINFIIPRIYIQTLNLQSLKYRCNFFLLFNPSHLIVTQILGILILMFIIAGYYVKITSLFQFWITASFCMLLPPYFNEGDRVNMLLTLLLIPVCLFDNRKNHWNEPVTTNTLHTSFQNFFLFLIKLQVAFIYFDSFHDKLKIREWKNGTVIYYWFTHNFFGLNSRLLKIAEPALLNLPLLIIIAWGSLTLEALLAAGLLFPSRIKLLLLKCGVIFHLCIMLVHGFASFFLVMTAALFLYLYPAKRSFFSNIIKPLSVIFFSLIPHYFNAIPHTGRY